MTTATALHRAILAKLASSGDIPLLAAPVPLVPTRVTPRAMLLGAALWGVTYSRCCVTCRMQVYVGWFHYGRLRLRPCVSLSLSHNNRTKRPIAHNATSGIASPPRAWSIETGQCSAARTPPRAVRPSGWRDQEAARSNRRESPSSVSVTSQWHAVEGADQAARMPCPPYRQHSRDEGHHEGVRHMLLAAVRAPRV